MKIHLLVFLSAALPALVAQQESRGTLLGRVTDPSGAAVAGAAIAVSNVATNVTLHAASNEEGNYHLPFLAAGDYNVTVEHAGFKAIQRQGIRVSMNARVTLDLALEVGAVSESVTVKADAPLVEAANADLGQVVENAYVKKIEFGLTRNALTLVFLSAGVTGTEGGTYTAGTLNNVSVNGGGGKRGGNEYLVDGFPSTTFGADQTFVPTFDTIEELKITTTLFDASMGRTNGGVVNVTTKGGTNELHGATYFYRNPVGLASNGWTNNKYGYAKQPSGYWQWGFQTGGPVYLPKIYNGRNRTFFSISSEQDHDPRFGTIIYRTPTALERQGDFSQTLSSSGKPLVIYDPATTAIGGNSATRKPFPGAKIPAARFDPTGAAYMNFFALPNLNVAPQIGVVNWSAQSQSGSLVSQKNHSGRLDQYISQRQRLFTRMSFMSRTSEAAISDYFLPLSAGGSGRSTTHFWNWGADDTITFSPSLVGVLRLNAGGTTFDSHSGGAGIDPALIKTPQVIANNQAFKGLPTFNLGESFGSVASGASRSSSMVYSFGSNFTKVKGNHNIRWGLDYRLGRNSSLNPGGNAFGNFAFDPVFTRSDPYTNSTSTTSGTSMASLLLGLPASGALGYNTSFSTQAHNLGLFIQEDWKTTRKLTLNFGLRYDLDTPYAERYNRQSYGFDYNAPLPVQAPGLKLKGGLLFAGVDGHPRTLPLDKNNFGPRFGFAYQALPKTVLRGGLGWFYGFQAYGRVDPGVFGALTNFVGTTDNGATPYNTLASPFPGGLTQPLGSSIGLLAQVGNALSIPGPNPLNSYNLQWQFDVQRELPSRILAEVAYVGMHSLKQSENFNLNEMPDQYLALGAAQNNRIPNPFLGVFPATSTLGQGATITQKQLWGAFPQYTSLTIAGQPTGKAIYHSMQAKVEKRLTNGLTVLTHYTYSKLMVSNTTSLVNPRHYRSISPVDQTQVFRQAFTYELPFKFAGHGFGKWLVRGIAGGWQMGGFYEYVSGVPLSVTQANGRPLRIAPVALSGAIEDRLGDRRDPSGKVLNPYFNINAFQALPTQYMVTPEPPVLGELRAPANKNLNLSGYKYVQIAERVKLMVSVELDKVTNSPMFDSPGLNMSAPATFGVIQTDHGQRRGKIGLRLWF